MFAGPMKPGAALIAKYCGTNISANVRDGALSQQKDLLTYCYSVEIFNGISSSKVTTMLLNWCKDILLRTSALQKS